MPRLTRLALVAATATSVLLAACSQQSETDTTEQAIKGVTIFPAWQIRMEDKIGSIEVGKYADLVILEKNLFDVKPRDIADVNVVATMMDGKFTYQAKDKLGQEDFYSKNAQVASAEFFRIFYHDGHDHHAKHIKTIWAVE